MSAWEPPADPDLKALYDTCMAEWLLDKPKTVAFDTETTGLEFHDTAFGGSVAWLHDDVLTGTKTVRGHWLDFTRINGLPLMCKILGAADTIIAHNAKFDLHRMERQGWKLGRNQQLHDTEAMSHLDDEHRSKGLKSLAVEVLGYDDTIEVPGKKKNKETGEMEDVVRLKPRSVVELGKAKEWAKKKHGLASVKEVGYHLLPRGVLVPYAVLDAEWTLSLAMELWPRIERYPDLHEVYDREIALSRGAIYEMERAGMGTNTAYVSDMVLEYRKRCIKHELAIEQIVGRPVRTGKIPPKERADFFNPSASSPDAGALLAAAGYERDSYDADALAAIPHPLAKRLLEYRKDTKILDSYFVALQRDTGPDGIFHPSLRQHGTVSGRTSAGAERGD